MRLGSKSVMRGAAAAILVGTFAVSQTATALTLTPGSGASNVQNVGTDVTTTQRQSVAPVFPGNMTKVDGSDLSVTTSSDHPSGNYDGNLLNDDTGFEFNRDPFLPAVRRTLVGFQIPPTSKPQS